MSIKIFIDTNVFLNSYLNRDNGISERIFTFLEEGNFEIYLNDISIINIAYIIKKDFSRDEIKDKINLIVNQYNTVCADEKIILDANNSKFKDFEDGVQYFCAKKINADLIITNNKKDFKFSDIDVITSLEFSLLYLDEG